MAVEQERRKKKNKIEISKFVFFSNLLKVSGTVGVEIALESKGK